MTKYKLILLFITLIFYTSCAVVKPYDMVYLNDSEMDPGNTSPKNHEKYIQSIREGATPSGGSKSSGGCGCN